MLIEKIISGLFIGGIFSLFIYLYKRAKEKAPSSLFRGVAPTKNSSKQRPFNMPKSDVINFQDFDDIASDFEADEVNTSNDGLKSIGADSYLNAFTLESGDHCVQFAVAAGLVRPGELYGVARVLWTGESDPPDPWFMEATISCPACGEVLKVKWTEVLWTIGSVKPVSRRIEGCDKCNLCMVAAEVLASKEGLNPVLYLLVSLHSANPDTNLNRPLVVITNFLYGKIRKKQHSSLPNKLSKTKTPISDDPLRSWPGGASPWKLVEVNKGERTPEQIVKIIQKNEFTTLGSPDEFRCSSCGCEIDMFAAPKNKRVANSRLRRSCQNCGHFFCNACIWLAGAEKDSEEELNGWQEACPNCTNTYLF